MMICIFLVSAGRCILNAHEKKWPPNRDSDTSQITKGNADEYSKSRYGTDSMLVQEMS